MLFQSIVPYIFILLGIALILFPFVVKPAIERLAKSGERCEGVVFQLDYKSKVIDMMHEDTITKDKITIRFVTQKQEWITADLDTSFMLLYPGRFKEGDTVPVIYDPNNPSDFTIETKQSPGMMKILLALAGAAFLLVGVYKLLLQAP